MSDNLSFLSTAVRDVDLIRWRYIAEGVIPLKDQCDDNGQIVADGIVFDASAKGGAYVDGKGTANFQRFYDPKRKTRINLCFPDGRLVSGYVVGLKGETGLLLSTSPDTADGKVLSSTMKAINPASVVYTVWRAE